MIPAAFLAHDYKVGTEKSVKRSQDREKVLVVNPPLEIPGAFIDYPEYVNLGAVCAAAALRAQGFDVKAADAFALPDSGARWLPGGHIHLGCDSRALLGSHAPGDFDAVVLCLSVFHRPFLRHEFTADFIRLAREAFPDALIVAADACFGGMHFVDYASETFFGNYPQCDALVRYECEAELPKLLRTAERGVPVAVDGRGEHVILDELLHPAWDLIDANHYFKFLERFYAAAGRSESRTNNGPCLPVAASRGCPFRCAFCAPPVSRGISPYRSHSVEYLSKYLRALKTAYGIRGVAFLDGIANAHTARFAALLDDLAKLGLEAAFPNGLRADLLQKETVEKLAALCSSVAVSAESASERVRNELLGKNLDLSAVERVASWCAGAGLPLQIHYMIGAPGETVEEVNMTLEHAARMAREQGAAPLLQFCAPVPGTPLREQCLDQGLALREFNEDYFSLFHETPAIDAPPLPESELRSMFARFKMRLRENEPEKVIVNLTYRCGNKCAMCAVGGRPAMDMPKKRALELLRDFRMRGVRLADFDGGEPTLHPDLFALISAARRMGYERVNITTNGRKMADRGYASRLLLSGITDLLISLYGADERTHENVTRAQGSFEQTVQGIRHAVELKPERIEFGVNTVVTADNYNLIEELLDFVAELGVQNAAVQYPTPFGRGSRKHVPPYEETAELVNRAMRKLAGRVRVSVINLPPCRMPGAEDLALADAGKYSRVMAFVNEPPENLGVYLARKRSHSEKCASCPYRIVCEGEYVFDNPDD